MVRNRIIQGECAATLRRFPDTCVDLVVTDPPYLVSYRDRTGRSLAGDNAPDMVLPCFPELYRVLRPNSLCVCFYGWNRVDLFMTSWKEAGFAPVGHIVWHKTYSSRTGFLKSCHEQAYLLAKGRPRRPDRPIADVQPWEYSGNKFHPTEKAVSVLSPLIRSFSRPGDLVLDPFSGSGSTSVAAHLAGRDYCGIELERRYCVSARRRLSDARNPSTSDGRTLNRPGSRSLFLERRSLLNQAAETRNSRQNHVQFQLESRAAEL